MAIARRVWRILVGVKDGLALLLLLVFFGGLFVLLSSGPDARDNAGGALLLELNGTLSEQPAEASAEEILTGAADAGGQIRMRDLVHAIETAARDDDIKTVVLDLDGFWGGGAADLQRVGQALDTVRAAKKPVLAYATGYTDDGYYLAAHASEVWMDAMGAALFTGPGGTRPYFKGLADKIGATVNVYRVGKYKSFVEPYVRTEASPEAKAEDQALVDALWAEWLADVARVRPKAKVSEMAADPAGLVDTAGGELAKAAQAAGLVDRLADRTAFGDRVAQLSGKDDEERPGSFQFSSLSSYIAANPESGGSEAIGIITIAGEIVDGDAPAGTAGGGTISGLIRTALVEEDLKALVVRVNSPGGSAFASEEIRRALLEVKARKIPVVVSMGNVAASGGYWVAMTGDRIFADPATITGSIGVFSLLPTFENAIGKAGISADGVATTPLTGQPDMLRGTNETTDRLMQAGVEDIYRRFTGMVSDKRKLDLAKVLDVAQGRVWDGAAARKIGLVDQFGTLDDAINAAAKLAGVEPDDVSRVWLEREPGWLPGVLGGFVRAQPAPAADIFTRLASARQAQLVAGLSTSARILAGPAVQVRCLACPPSATERAWRRPSHSLWTAFLQFR